MVSYCYLHYGVHGGQCNQDHTATYTMEFMKVNVIKIRLYSLEVVGYILKDIKLICEQFVSIYIYIYIY